MNDGTALGNDAAVLSLRDPVSIDDGMHCSPAECFLFYGPCRCGQGSGQPARAVHPGAMRHDREGTRRHGHLSHGVVREAGRCRGSRCPFHYRPGPVLTEDASGDCAGDRSHGSGAWPVHRLLECRAVRVRSGRHIEEDSLSAMVGLAVGAMAKGERFLAIASSRAPSPRTAGSDQSVQRR